MTQEDQPKGFKRAKKQAKQLLDNPEKLKDLLSSAQRKANSKRRQLKTVWNDFQVLQRLIKAWWKKDYNEVPWKTILYIATAILYFVNPLDIIPDFIPISGFIDDITIITFVIQSIKEDLGTFLKWEQSNLKQ